MITGLSINHRERLFREPKTVILNYMWQKIKLQPPTPAGTEKYDIYAFDPQQRGTVFTCPETLKCMPRGQRKTNNKLTIK